MNLIEKIEYVLRTCLVDLSFLNASDAHTCTLDLQVDESKSAFGDLTTNIALTLAKQNKENPRVLAQRIIDHFVHPGIDRIEIAGPGFMNFFLKPEALSTLAQELFSEKEAFFKLPADIPTYTISLEFVSANPTGPLHFGHGRGGIIGDVLGNILSFLGHTVTKEFYINDAGAQIKKLGISLKARYLQLSGVDAPVPEDGYHGEYLIEVAQSCVAIHGNQLLDQPDTFFEDYAKTYLLKQIRHTLHDYGIHFDVWFSEKTLHDNGDIDRVLAYLKDNNYLYEKDGAWWFCSTQFGDDKDRVVRKASGELTYVAADIAYLENKIERGNNYLMFVLGHDHHSYATRLLAARTALGYKQIPLDVILYQLVKIKEGGQQVRMSKRAGKIVDLQGIIDTVGKDVARFFYLNRKADAQLEFDLNLALTKTEENPVYYIQYAYVRTNSILEKINQEPLLQNITDLDAQYLTPEESLLIKKIASLKQLLADISHNHQTHALAYYSHELAQLFSRYYSKHRVIDLADPNRSRARLMLVMTLRNTLHLCLTLMGISQPVRM